MNAQKRRLKQLEHRREVERLLQERRAMFEAERDAALAEHEEAAARELDRMSIVEEERQRILRAHAAVLGLHDLPKGVLKSDEDKALFSQYGASPGARAARAVRRPLSARARSHVALRLLRAPPRPNCARRPLSRAARDARGALWQLGRRGLARGRVGVTPGRGRADGSRQVPGRERVPRSFRIFNSIR